MFKWFFNLFNKKQQEETLPFQDEFQTEVSISPKKAAIQPANIYIPAPRQKDYPQPVINNKKPITNDDDDSFSFTQSIFDFGSSSSTPDFSNVTDGSSSWSGDGGMSGGGGADGSW